MSETDGFDQKPPALASIELRVLGVLMEKQLTTPDQYPLTVNSVVTACNQKSNREPVTNYTQGDITRTLQELLDKRFVVKEYGSRADKYSQNFIKHLELGKKHQALLCVMMLRGPQTLSELSTRTQRMVAFTDKEDLEHSLHRLCKREVPYVVRLAQQSGQREERFTHLFSGTPSQSIPDAGEGYVSAAPTQDKEAFSSTSTAPRESAEHKAGQADIEDLRAQLTELSEECSLLKQQIQHLYQLTGYKLEDVVDE